MVVLIYVNFPSYKMQIFHSYVSLPAVMMEIDHHESSDSAKKPGRIKLNWWVARIYSALLRPTARLAQSRVSALVHTETDKKL